MIEGGLVRKIPALEGGKRMAYALTEKGQALWPVVVALRDWGLTWEPGTQASLVARAPDGSLDEDPPRA
jgi:DNA-binding HxlR family transcriptional regulator